MQQDLILLVGNKIKEKSKKKNINTEELEKKEQHGSSLAHYLKAQKLYPSSDFAREGVTRLVKQVLPES